MQVLLDVHELVEDSPVPSGARWTLADGNVVWLPRGSTRNITAGNNGLSYLTIHRRRPGLQIRKRLR